MKPYLQRIKEFANNLDKEIISEIEKISVRRKFKKEAILLQPGQICYGHILIEDGIGRRYYYYHGKEI